MSRAKIEPTELIESYVYALYLALGELQELDKMLPPDCPPLLRNGKSEPHINLKFAMALITPLEWKAPDGTLLPLKKWPKGDQAAVKLGIERDKEGKERIRRSPAAFFIDVINKTWTFEKDRPAYTDKTPRAKSGAAGTAKLAPASKPGRKPRTPRA